MPIFKYKILDPEGKPKDGTMEAKDKFSLYHAVKQDGSTVISAQEITEKKGNSLSNINLPFLGGVKTHDKITFAKNLAKMIDAGLPMTRAIAIMEKESQGKLKDILGKINDSISTGNTLSDSMKNYPDVFSQLFVSMVKAGEESGNLSLALQNVGLQMEKSYQLNKKIRGALMYPTIIVFLMIAIGVLMMIYMVPTLTSTFQGLGIKLPLSTRIIIGTSNFLVAYFLYVIIGFIALVIGIVFLLRTERAKKFLDFVFLHVPVIKEMVKQINSARTARTLSSLISSGVDIVVAIDVTKDVLQNYYYKQVLEEIRVVIEKGGSISAVFSAHEELYPTFVSEMASVGEETGKIGDMLLSSALFYEDEIDQKTKDLSSVIEPFLMIFIGIAVGFFVISIISPIYSIGDSIK